MANPVFIFTAKLGLMGRSGDLAPYDTAHIEAPSEAEAIQRAKRWADEVVLADDSHLQVLFDGKAVASFKPGEF